MKKYLSLIALLVFPFTFLSAESPKTMKTKNGEVKIEKLNVGDEVYVFDFAQECLNTKRISKIYNNWTNRYFTIRTRSEDTILSSSKHLFWVEKLKKWIPAKELEIGMSLKDLNANNSEISSIEKTENIDVPTFNLEVEDIHNYFVGSFGVLVHNQN